MFIYHGKTFESAHAAGYVVGVVCEQCDTTYYYELARIGTGAQTAPYGIGKTKAAQQAHTQSEADLEQRLAGEAELVPCPKCHWISDSLVQGYRLGRYRFVGKLAFTLGFAGSLLSLVVAWYIHIGSPLERWRLPYVLIGGPVIFSALGVSLLLLRSFLRSRIQPNLGSSQESRLPLGTPPALLLDEATQTLRPANPPSASEEGYLDVQVGRARLPACCCECLQADTADHAYAVQVTRLVQLNIPRCTACIGKSDRAWRRIALAFTGLGLLVGGAMVLLMVLAAVQTYIIVVSSLVLFGAFATLSSVVAARRNAPVTVLARDRARGVVRLQFRNPSYTQMARAQG
jgi:hypothetical protein